MSSIELKEVKYYAILQNLQYAEYESQNSALEGTNLFALIIKRGVTKSQNGNLNSVYQFEIVSKEFTRYFLQNNWKLETEDGWHTYNLGIKIIDPNGQIKRLQGLQANIQGVIEGYKIFIEYSSHKDLKTVELIEKIASLEKENLQLKEEIANLRK